MYNPLNTTLFECRWHSSNYLLCFYTVLYGGALLVTFQLPLGIGWRVLIIIVLSCYAVWTFLKHILFVLPSSFIGLRRSSVGWFISSRNNDWQNIQLVRTGCIILPWVIILQFRVIGYWRSLTVCIPKDAMSPVEHRKLRVYLRYLT